MNDVAELEREADRADRGFGIVAVHVENRRLHRLRDVGRVHGRAGEAGRGRETDLVVDDDVHRAADVVARKLGKVERLGDDTLARERGVAVHEHGQHAVVVDVAEPILLGARHALGDRVDRFEVTRVRGERDRRSTRPMSEVNLPVAPTWYFTSPEPCGTFGSSSPSNSRKICSYDLPTHVREHVEPAAVRHAHHDLFDTGVGGRVEQEVEHRDQRLAAFEAESLLAEELGVQEALERFGAVEVAERMRRLSSGVIARARLRLVLDPRLLIGLLDVHVLDADGARVRVAQHAENVAQLHHRRDRRGRRSGTRGRDPRS